MKRAGRLLGEGIRDSGLGIRHSGRAARAAKGDCSPVAAACVCAFALSCLRGGSACSLRCARSKGRMRARRWGWGRSMLAQAPPTALPPRALVLRADHWSRAELSRGCAGNSAGVLRSRVGRGVPGKRQGLGGGGRGAGARARGGEESGEVAEWRSGENAGFWGWWGVRRRSFWVTVCARFWEPRCARGEAFGIRHSAFGGGHVGQKSTRPAFAGRVEGYMCISDVED